MGLNNRKKVDENKDAFFVDNSDSELEGSEDENLEVKETLASKRRRLAKSYIDEIKADDDQGIS